MEFFNTLDYGALFKIVGIDIMLGVDNAIVIALACATLPAHMRMRAVAYGTAGAVILRAVLLAFAGFLLNLEWVRLIAGAYLLYIGYSLLAESDDAHDVQGASHVWGAIKTIIVADFMMSLDNVLGVAAAAQSAGEHSTAYAIAGIVFSIPIIVFGARWMMRLMDRFPIIVWMGAGLLGWVGAEMMISDPVSHGVLEWLEPALGDLTHLTLKLAGFAAVVFAVLAVRHLPKGRVPEA